MKLKVDGLTGMVVVFKLDGERKELHLGKLAPNAWMELKAVGFTVLGLVEGIQRVDMEAFEAIVWLERKQRERNLRYAHWVRDTKDEEHDFEFVGLIDAGKVVIGDEDEVLGVATAKDAAAEGEEENPTPAS